MNTAGFSIAEQVIEGEFYAVLYNSFWHRVQICSPSEDDGTVTCFMVDTGEQLNISKDQICYLEPAFMKTKTQVKCTIKLLANVSLVYLKEVDIVIENCFFHCPINNTKLFCFHQLIYKKKIIILYIFI